MAVENRATRTTNANTNIEDNVTRNITPVDVRQSVIDNIDSSFSLPDDYEVVDFTPTLLDSGGGAIYTIGTTFIARAIRIRQLVYIQIHIASITDVGIPSGEVRLGNFPFTIRNQPNYSAPIDVLQLGNDTQQFSFITGQAMGGTNYMRFRFQNGITTSMNINVFQSIGFTNDTIQVAGWYQGNNA